MKNWPHQSMTKNQAWEIISEHCEHPYDPCEEEEMAEYIAEFDKAYGIVEKEMTS